MASQEPTDPSVVPQEEVKSRPALNTPRTREPLTREAIIGAALRIMDEEGLEAVTMRRVGRDLGVEAMSLYNHVHDKEDILDGVCEAVLAEFEYEPTSDDWVEQARLAAGAWRDLLRRHPNVMTLLSERKHPLMSLDALRPMEIALEVLHRAGLSAPDAVQAFHAFGGYIMGFVMMETGPAFGMDDEHHGLMHQEMTRAVPVEALPRVVEALPHFEDCDWDAQFEFGLDLMIEGVRARIARRSRTSPRPERAQRARGG